MHSHDCHDNGCGCHAGAPNPGLLGVFGGIINLTTASLRGGANIIRTVVEGSVWHSHQHDRCGCGGRPVCHCYHTECSPRTYGCGCCD